MVLDKILENAPTKLKVSVNVNDADWQKIQELFAKERQWMTAQMQMHIREVGFGFLFVVSLRITIFYGHIQYLPLFGHQLYLCQSLIESYTL